MRHLVASILWVIFCSFAPIAPIAHAAEVAAMPESWKPSVAALGLAKDIAATPLDRSRTAQLAQRFQRIVLDAKLANQPTQLQISSGLDASWVVASCWPADVFDRRMHISESEDVPNLRAFFEDAAALKEVRDRLVLLRTEYNVYAEAMNESLAKALCPKERQDAIISSLKRNFIRQQAIQNAMCSSPIWWKTFARVSTDSSSITAKAVMPALPPGEPAPVQPMTWSDWALRRFPIALDPAVSPVTAAAAFALDADCRIMSLSNL